MDFIIGILIGIIITILFAIIFAWVDYVNDKLKILEQRLDKQNEVNEMFKVKKKFKESED